MGNHEEVMLRVLDGDGSLLREWLKFGGVECVRSYGLDPAELKQLDAKRALELLKNAVPNAHVDFLRSFADTVSFGSYLFVHAGIRPGVPLSEQRQTDLRWIRDPFLDDVSDHGFMVVHGHTITASVEVQRNRIGLDTGAYRSGVLSALRIEGSDRWLLQTANAMPSHPEPIASR
jgi:serine/threonine protein phosphatase 1